MFYSKSAGGFFDRNLHGSNMPEDVVEITQAHHANLLAGQAMGLRIVADAQGVPELAEQPVPARAQLVDQTLATARQLRSPILGVLDGMQASALTTGDQARALAIEAAKQGLKDITKVDLSACETEADMRQSILLAYVGIAKALPGPVQAAFAEVLS